jgi:hypothetical protein
VFHCFPPLLRNEEARRILYLLDGVAAEREVLLTLLLPQGLARQLVGGEAATDGAGLLLTQVKGSVLRVLVVREELLLLGLVDHGQNAGDGLADLAAVEERGEEKGRRILEFQAGSM